MILTDAERNSPESAYFIPEDLDIVITEGTTFNLDNPLGALPNLFLYFNQRPHFINLTLSLFFCYFLVFSCWQVQRPSVSTTGSDLGVLIAYSG